MSEDVTNANQPTGMLKWSVISLLSVGGLTGLCILMVQMTPITTVSSRFDFNRTPDLKHGQKIYTVSCATCHGPGGMGLPHQGAPLAASAFVSMGTDQQVMQMIKIGRTPEDPKSVMHLPMPAKGGYSNLTDANLHDVVAYIRTLEKKTDAADSKKSTTQTSKGF